MYTKRKTTSKWRREFSLLYFVLFFCPFVLLMFSIWGDFSPFRIFNPIEQVTTPRTKTIINTLLLREVSYWSAKGTVEHLLIANENLAILGVRGFRGMNLVILDVETGEFWWKNTSYMRSLGVDNKRIYIGRIKDVLAYDLETGQKFWEYEQPLKGRGGMYVFTEDDKIKVYDDDVSKPLITDLLNLDPQTGKLLSVEEIPEQFHRPRLTYRMTANADFEYIIVSNGQIVATDIQTGQEIGCLKMTSPSIYDKIAASDEFLVVYNDNNQELIVFKQEN